MSDLQFITGIAILFSGFLQLPCGLSTYHWLVLVDLAWFSSLTHLSCLTVLRHHLSSHAFERGWRLCTMGLLATLLAVALGFTGNYSWALDEGHKDERHPRINSYTVCHLRVSSSTNSAFVSMVLSELLILIGFISRALKMYKGVSVNGIGRVRSFLSSHARRRLLTVYESCETGSPHSLRRTLYYYPLFALFLESRFLLDFWTSVLFEVRAVTAILLYRVLFELGWLAAGSFHLGFDTSRQSTISACSGRLWETLRRRYQ